MATLISKIIDLILVILPFLKRNEKSDTRIIQQEFTTETPLAKHDVFKILRVYREIVVDKLNLEHITRTEVFRDFLTNYIDISGNILHELAVKIDKKCINPNCRVTPCPIAGLDLLAWNKEAFEAIFRNTFNYYLDSNKNYKPEEIELLRYVTDLFRQYHENKGIAFLRQAIDCTATNSRYTKCSKILQVSIFSAYTTFYNVLLYGTEKEYKNTNGFFLDKTFNKRFYEKPKWIN